ncbi:MAG: 1-(5-phosphoribosyl)-5-[(5-phosphoribosylamino)methylideneamino]imidazole-4-carboxamide isomerase [Chloroflexi bacterium]|nr:1-(5-phosphoribosyl)-5-[(5-phosphoribosylamino)methylideneamino]imidazole-4-carboxamide isomerase [Chloroflexota bacterium]
MQVIPAIDIRQGRCVRLYQGDYARETVYSSDPVAVARRWESLGAGRIHMVDLDGAVGGKLQNLETVEAVLRGVKTPVQLGGGIRNGETVEGLLKLGIGRVVLGTAALENPGLVAELCTTFGDRIVVGIDARDGMVASHGWTQRSTVPAAEMAQRMVALGVRRIVYTDISRDGTLTSPNFQALAELQARVTIPIIASGGVSSLAHIEELALRGVEGVIVGKALYDGALSLPEALASAEKDKRMTHKYEVSKIDRLDSPGRLKRLPPFEDIFSVLPIRPSHSIADIGCGTGVFSLPLAAMVPQGKVYCLDIAEEMLERVRIKVRDNNISNVEVKRTTESDLGVPPGSLDGVFMSFVFHEQEDRVAFLTALRGLLKDGGWVGIVEWVKKEMPVGPPLSERIDPAEARQLAARAGLTVSGEKALGEDYYIIVLGK